MGNFQKPSGLDLSLNASRCKCDHRGRVTKKIDYENLNLEKLTPGIGSTSKKLPIRANGNYECTGVQRAVCFRDLQYKREKVVKMKIFKHTQCIEWM
jgi:hypothetical protein